ncbi:hypothetical protein HK096_007412, partial [Nowakowskiella sp. JEL0078]
MPFVSAKRIDKKSGKVSYEFTKNGSKEWLSLSNVGSDTTLTDAIEIFEHSNHSPKKILSQKRPLVIESSESDSASVKFSDGDASDAEIKGSHNVLKKVAEYVSPKYYKKRELRDPVVVIIQPRKKITVSLKAKTVQNPSIQISGSDDNSISSFNNNSNDTDESVSSERSKSSEVSEKIKRRRVVKDSLKTETKSNSHEKRTSFHHQKCDKCGFGKSRGRKDEFSDDPGKLIFCKDCTSCFHDKCLSKSKIGSPSNFLCPSCIKASPVCRLCKNVVSDSNLIIPPKFRCERCEYIGHWSCLKTEYSLWYDVKEKDIQKNEPGSYEWYAKTCRCLFCDFWDCQIEMILTYRNREDSGDKLEIGREYLVKFVNNSYRKCTWVPGLWVEGLKSEKAKVRNFWKMVEEQTQYNETNETEISQTKLWPKSKKDSFNQDFAKVDRILAVEEDIKNGEVKIKRVYVKWKSLLYDQCTWEIWPEKTELDYNDFATALNYLNQNANIHDDHLKYESSYTSLKQKRRFSEFETQPECIVNGELKDYQV